MAATDLTGGVQPHELLSQLAAQQRARERSCGSTWRCDDSQVRSCKLCSCGPVTAPGPAAAEHLPGLGWHPSHLVINSHQLGQPPAPALPAALTAQQRSTVQHCQHGVAAAELVIQWADALLEHNLRCHRGLGTKDAAEEGGREGRRWGR